jgi:hypothetical protein
MDAPAFFPFPFPLFSLSLSSSQGPDRRATGHWLPVTASCQGRRRPVERPALSGSLPSLGFSGGCVAPLHWPCTRDWRATASRALGEEIASPLARKSPLKADIIAALRAKAGASEQQLIY